MSDVESLDELDGHFSGIPVLPLRDVVVFPLMVVPLFVGRKRSILALDKAMSTDRKILLLTQKSASVDEPSEKEMYKVGVMSTVLQLVKMPDDNIKVLIEGGRRVEVEKMYLKGGCWVADGNVLTETCVGGKNNIDAAMRAVSERFSQYAKSTKKISADVLQPLDSMEDPGRLADAILTHLDVKISEKQKCLEESDKLVRVEYLLGLIAEETDISLIEQRIRGRIKNQMEKTQREYYLNEQMKAIQKELGEIEDMPGDIDGEYVDKLNKARMPRAARKVAEEEIHRLSMIPPLSAEAAVIRNYLDWLLQMPWSKRTRSRMSINDARGILDNAHYGLDEVKERIIEYLSVQKRVKRVSGSILCLVGPPGVGKTSLGRSIAEAAGRKFTRVSLGGVRDEAEIRGHRRTYIGSLPGKIVRQMAKANSKNPLFLLDEVDKISMNYRGDPASALLEVLDSEQNNTFSDHFLEVEFDLSEVLFVCTANSTDIPPPLLDRMEVIRLSGYTEEEKHRIASKFLLPKQKKANGVRNGEMSLSGRSLVDIIRFYTREAGVRSLERCIAKICRKVVTSAFIGKHMPASSSRVNAEAGRRAKTRGPSGENRDTVVTTVIRPSTLAKYLGVRKYNVEKPEKKNLVGIVNALAWTSVGGDILKVEAAVLTGTGKLLHTGQLGDVMQESVKAALTVVRSRSSALGIAPRFATKKDFHIHALEGATPKDGPSAGVSICTALVSALTNVAVRNDVAMTGEISLLGSVLKIGGLKEKLLAAVRSDIKEVIIPYENKLELKEVPDKVLSKLKLHFVKNIDEVLVLALVKQPFVLSDDNAGEAGEKKRGFSAGSRVISVQ